MSIAFSSSTSSTLSAPATPWENPVIWIDLEMTGLNPDTDVIVEAAIVVTDGLLKRRVEGPNVVINASPTQLATMNEWCKKTFTKSGLLPQIQQSTLTMEDAEKEILQFLIQQEVPQGVAPLAGNSVGNDRAFLRRYMPALHSFLHYRTLDVSSIKLLKMFWYPDIPTMEKKLTHRALDDIRESIAELEYYRRTMFTKESSAMLLDNEEQRNDHDGSPLW